MVAMAMYYRKVKAPLTVPLYLYFVSASPWQSNYRYNGTVRGALTITYVICTSYMYIHTGNSAIPHNIMWTCIYNTLHTEYSTVQYSVLALLLAIVLWAHSDGGG